MKIETNYKILRLALICSIILNLAFIGGFLFKRTLGSKTDNAVISSEDKEMQCPAKDMEGKGGNFHPDRNPFGLVKLCKENPEFKKLHQEHGLKLKENMQEMFLLRKKILEKIKNGDVTEKDLESIIAEFNTMNKKFETDNIQHLLALKKILKKEDFEKLMDRLIYELSSHKHGWNKFVGNKQNKQLNSKMEE